MSDFTIHKLNVKLLDGIDASQTSVASSPLNVQSISFFSYQITWTGFTATSPVVTILASNSLSEQFIAIDSFIPTGTTGGRLINVEKAGYAFVKVTYSCATGAGTLTASINGKV